MKCSNFGHTMLSKAFIMSTMALCSLVCMPPTAEAGYYLAYNIPDNDNWVFNKEMLQSEENPNVWYYEMDIYNANSDSDIDYTAFFTFFNGPATGWENNYTRYGYDGDYEPDVEFNTSYSLKEKSDKCFKINSSGKYRIEITEDNLVRTVKFIQLEDYIDPDPKPSKYYVYLENTNDWNEPYVWAWIESEENKVNCTSTQKWPGDKMIATEDAGFYYWEAPAGLVPTKIIFNPGSDNGKTADLDFHSGYTYKGDGSSYEGRDHKVIVGPNPPVPG